MMDPDAEAILDVGHRTCVGYETFFFASEAAKSKFDSAITKYCGILTDPVTKTRFRPTERSPRSRHNERIYLFAADSSKASFDMMPEMYALPGYTMLPKTAGLNRVD